jgi:GNAT superfamily N-acetyltransferase
LSEPLHFDSAYHERARLDDGAEVTLRLVKPEDKELLVRGFERLSPESRYRRFFTQKERLNAEELRYLTEVDGVDHFAIGVVGCDEAGHEEGLGVARFVRLRNRPDTAEAAITVLDHAQGRGIGRLLFQRIAAAALERGVVRLRCEVLAENQPMRAILDEIAPGAVVEDDGAVLVFEFPLPEVAPGQPSDEATRTSPLYRLLVLAAEGRVVIRRAVDRLGHLIPRLGKPD